MPRKARTYDDVPVPYITFLADLADEDDAPVYTRWCSKAEAFKFRQQLYSWRRSLAIALARPDSPEATHCLAWLRAAIHPGIHKEWIDATIFEVEENTAAVAAGAETGRAIMPSPAWRVRASIKQPIYGDLVTLRAQAR